LKKYKVGYIWLCHSSNTDMATHLSSPQHRSQNSTTRVHSDHWTLFSTTFPDIPGHKSS